MRYNLIGLSDLYEVVARTGNIIELEPVGFHGDNILIAEEDLSTMFEPEVIYEEESMFGEPID